MKREVACKTARVHAELFGMAVFNGCQSTQELSAPLLYGLCKCG